MVTVTLYKHPTQERYSTVSFFGDEPKIGKEAGLMIAVELGRANYSDPEEAKKIALDILTASGVPEKEVYINFRDRDLE